MKHKMYNCFADTCPWQQTLITQYTDNDTLNVTIGQFIETILVGEVNMHENFN